VLVSDCKAQADFVRAHDVGAVHIADDTASFAQELRALLARRDEVVQVIAHSPDLLEPYAWERQETALRTFYRQLLGAPDSVTEPARASTLDGLTEVPRSRTDRPSVVGIGPANMAGQAWEWAKALERHLPGLDTEVIVVDRGSSLVFEADEIVPAATYAKDARWAQALESRALDTWTHALLEAGRPMFGLRHGRDFSGDVPVLRAVGIQVGLPAARLGDPQPPPARRDDAVVAVPRSGGGAHRPIAARLGPALSPRGRFRRTEAGLDPRTCSPTFRVASGCRSWSTSTCGAPTSR